MEINLFYELARGGGQLLIFITVLVGVMRFRTLQFEQKILLCLVTLTFIIELLALVLWKNGINNNFIFHFYAVVEFLLLGTLYTRHLEGLIKPMYMKTILALFVLFAAINTIFFQSLKQFNSHVTFVESLLLIIFSLLYFYKELRDLKHRHLEHMPMFWINTSVITYFSGAMVLFHVVNDLIPEPIKIKGVIWGTHALFNMVHYALYAIALWVKEDERRPVDE